MKKEPNNQNQDLEEKQIIKSVLYVEIQLKILSKYSNEILLRI